MRATGRVLAVATVVGALAGVADVAINWSSSHRHVDPEGAVTPPFSLSPSPGANSDPPPTPSSTPQPTATVPPSPPHRHDRPALPLELTLRDGEQRTFLGDQASVAVEFNKIGSEDFVTLRVGTTAGESVPHAVLGAGARFPVRVAGNDYSVYVLSVDKTARTVGVRISRNSEPQERGQ